VSKNVLIFADWAFFQRTGKEAALLPKMDQPPVQKPHRPRRETQVMCELSPTKTSYDTLMSLPKHKV
jgi:hypothetical protein